MRSSDWSSDVCSSDLADRLAQLARDATLLAVGIAAQRMLAAEPRADRVLLERIVDRRFRLEEVFQRRPMRADELPQGVGFDDLSDAHDGTPTRVSIRNPETRKIQKRSEEHKSELTSLMRNQYDVF